MNRLILSLSLLFLSLGLFAQDEIITVAGKVFDNATNAPMKFVSVGLEGTSIANITNSEGVFSLKVPASSLDGGVIFCSHLGYLESKTPVQKFKGYSVDKPLVILMTPVSFRIDAAVVNASEAESLILTAYDNVKHNYSREHQGMTAFYRELVKKGETKYISLNEAVLDIDKAPYNGFAPDRAGIYKGRGTINYDTSDTLVIKYQGGVSASFMIDLVKNPFAGVSPMDMFKMYDFRLEESVIQDNKTFYCVSFDQKEDIKEALYHGKVYIDADTYAIGRVEFELNVYKDPTVVNVYVVKHSPKTLFEVERVAYTVNYKEQDGLWFYDYSHIELIFNARHKYSPFRHKYSVVSEMAITDHRPGQIEIQNESKLKIRDQLSEKVSAFTDEDFWENYNVIEPDTNIDAIVRKIVRQLNRRSATR